MKKYLNGKGYFLAETIVVIALVTTIMAFVFPNVLKVHDNFNNQANKYDQVEDLYLLKANYEKLLSEGIISNKTKGGANNESGCKVFGDHLESILNIVNPTDGFQLKTLYITDYMGNPSDASDYNFNKYLKRLKKTSSDKDSYRLIGIFKKNEKTRYASIKIENPNPIRTCER